MAAVEHNEVMTALSRRQQRSLSIYCTCWSHFTHWSNFSTTPGLTPVFSPHPMGVTMLEFW